MSDLDPHAPPLGERHAGLFASLILQQSNMALMFLGKVPNPDTGKSEVDLNSARVFIDLLEMLEIKTKGNLSPQEGQMLKETLTGLRMVFVEAVHAKPPHSAPSSEPQPEPGATPPSQPASSDSAASETGAPQASQAEVDAESKRKFTKKY